MTYALVTGGAKRLGFIVTQHLVQKGYNIILHYNSSGTTAEEAATSLREYGVKVELCKADLSEKTQINFLTDFCKNFDVSVVINNASMFENDGILSDDIETSLEEHLMVNVVARVILIKEIVKSFRLHNMKRLDVINLLDYGMYKVPHNFFSYHLANKIMQSLVQLAAKQLPDVRVNGIALGQTLKNEKQPQEKFEEAISSTLLGCSSTPEELIQAVDFILTVSSMTGQIICLDGGMSLTDEKYK
jgi:NAD(P)-dependent dehydrogenase (short-subunit alcohol dehydrogenase family)